MKTLPKLTVPNATAWARWLTENGTSSTGVSLTLAKKNTTSPTSVTRSEAVEEALCHGWIDGQSNTIDESTYMQRYTPRAAKSVWSKKNVGIVEQLEKQGRMQAAGRAAVESAKLDGRWQRAYSGTANLEEMRDLMAAIGESPRALEAWEGMKKGEKAQVYFRLAALMTEAGRAKHIREYVAKLEHDDDDPPKVVGLSTATKSRKRLRLRHLMPKRQDLEGRSVHHHHDHLRERYAINGPFHISINNL
jgi:uncharacterized protein YdeI (YjbR/CyaY-like superfamily)